MNGGNVSKCSRPAKPVRGFKSLLLRQKTRGFPQFLREAAFFLCVQKRLVFRLSDPDSLSLFALILSSTDEIQTLDHSLSR